MRGVSAPILHLKRGRDSSVRRRHPWIFSGAISRVEGTPGPGDTVDVCTHDGQWLARAAYSPASQIRGRIWSWDPSDDIGADFFHRRLAASLGARGAATLPPDAARRLVYSESDGLPGLIVDRYGPFLVCQFLSTGAERWRAEITEQLAGLVAAQGIFERSDSSGRRQEGLPERSGVLVGVPPPAEITVEEPSGSFLVDVRRGHKTGFYLDQRENRDLVARRARDAHVLNVFSYTGGFGIAAAGGGAASVTNVESSAAANALARRAAATNGIPDERFRIDEGDAFQLLRRYREAGATFDLIVLDPPKFAESAAQVQRAARGYKDLNLQAFHLLRPGGVLFTFSCSGHMKPDLFQKIVADAALDAGRDAWIHGWLHQADDHPTALGFPEASYLKGLLVRVGART